MKTEEAADEGGNAVTRRPVRSAMTIQLDVMNDSVESPTGEPDVGEKFSPSRHHSMRRSRASGDVERDQVVLGPPPAARLPTAASLTPLTPLRWKSSKAMKDKPHEAFKPKEVVKEEVRNSRFSKEQNVVKEVVTHSKLSNEEPKEQNEAATVPKQEANGVEVPYKSDAPVLEVFDTKKEVTTESLPGSLEVSVPKAAKINQDLPVEESKGGKKLTSESEVPVLQQVMANGVQEKASELTLPSLEMSNGQRVDEQTKLCEEVSPTNVEQGMDQSSNGDAPGNDRKPSAGDEPSVITIDFLRARLLAERSSSKAARERIQQLSKKVAELEAKLEQEILLRKKSDEAAQEALLKLQSAGDTLSKETFENTKTASEVPGESQEPGHTSEPAADTSQTGAPPGVEDPGSVEEQSKQQSQDLLSTQEVKNPAQDDVEDTRAGASEASKLGNSVSASFDVKDGEGEERREDAKNSESGGDGTSGQSGTELENMKKIQSEDVRLLSISAAPDMKATYVDMMDPGKPGITRQEKRSAIEERVRNMWDQMTEEMAALAEDRSQEELVREELLNWMGQVPAVLQDILPKNSEENLVTVSSSESLQLEDAGVSLADAGSGQTQKRGGDPIEPNKEECPTSDGSTGKARKINSANKKVASLIERYEAQESVQREWEQNYYARQKPVGRRRSLGGFVCRTYSDPGTPLSPGGPQPYSQQETQKERPISNIHPHDKVSRFDVHVTSSPALLAKSKSAENFIPKKENGNVDIHAPHFDAPYTYPDPHLVPGVRVYQPEAGSRSHGGTKLSDDPSIGQRELGVERSFDPSFITPRLYSEPPEPIPRNSREDLRNCADRPQVHDQYYAQGASRGGTYENFAGHSGRSSTGREDVLRLQGLTGWRPLEEGHTKGESHSRGNPSQWDAPSVSPRLQPGERMPPYAQAGHSNAYMRPQVPLSYPLQNNEREIYRGRLESVSRSMEGLGSSWRSSSDVDGWHGDEGSPYVERFESKQRRGDTQIPAQVKESSGRSIDYHAENLAARPEPEGHPKGDTPLSLAYPGWEFSRDDVPKRPSAKIDNSSKVTEVLRALQIAKFNIQNSGTKKSFVPNPDIVSGGDLSYNGSDKARTAYGSEPGGGGPGLGSPAVGGWAHQEQRRHSIGHFREHGSPHLHMPSPSTTFKADYLQLERDAREDRPLAGRSSPVSNTQNSFLDKMSVGNGIQFFFP